MDNFEQERAHTTQPLQVDLQGAARVEAALLVLHRGDERVSQADQYLNDVRASSAAWPIVCALICNSATTQSGLLFAANTVFARLRSDWLSFSTDTERLTAFTVAVDGATRPDITSSLSPLHSFGRACGFALALASTEPLRQTMWALLMTRISHNPVHKCHVLAAVGKQFEETSTRNDMVYAVARSFCQQQVSNVMADAIAILKNTSGVSSPCLTATDQTIADMRAAISCIHAWCAHGDKSVMAHALLHALPVPQLADDVAETLSEIVAYTGTSHDLLLHVCEALIQIFHNASVPPQHRVVVRHAIAEVACTLVEGNADELMEQDAPKSKLVTVRVTDLLWLCLKTEDERSFFASIEGWTNWISADTLVMESRRVLHAGQVSAVVKLVLSRLAQMPIISALIPSLDDDECTEYASETAKVSDLLLWASTSIGISVYVSSLAPLLRVDKNLDMHLLCAALFALASAGDTTSEAMKKDEARCTSIIPALTSVMHMLEVFGTSDGGMCDNSVLAAAARRLGMQCLGSFVFVLGPHYRNTDFQRLVRLAATCVHDNAVGNGAANVLFEISQHEPKRLLPFLPELIPSCAAGMDTMRTQAAWTCALALANAASALRLHKERLGALSRILSTSCSHVRNICRRERHGEDVEEQINRHVVLISKAMQKMNDNVARASVYAELRDVVAELAMRYSANGVISRAICRLLETCVLPTLMDEEESDDDRDDGRDAGRQWFDCKVKHEEERVKLAMSCATLAIECFQRSAPRGEVCWLQAVKDITPHIISGFDSTISNEVKTQVLHCLAMILQTSLNVVTLYCGGDYATQPDMATCLFKQLTLIVKHPIACKTLLSTNVSVPTSRAGLVALRCSNSNIVRECLTFWNRVFRRETEVAVWRRLLTDAGGAKAVTAGVLCAAQVSRLGSVAADTVFAMCAVVAAAEGDDAADVLLNCLREAFAVDDVPRQGLDQKVKDMLFCGCVSSVRSKRDFRRALDNVGRVCGMAIR